MNVLMLFDELQQLLHPYGFWMVVLFAFLHPLTENPWSFFTLSLALTVLGAPLGYTAIALGLAIGIGCLYVIAHAINRWSKYRLLEKNISKRVLDWIVATDTWRHIVVIGLPAVPTYPIKLALPFSRMTFRRYALTLAGSYLFLYAANTALYYGIFGFVRDTIPNWVSVVLLMLFALYIYFGQTMRKKLRKSNI